MAEKATSTFMGVCATIANKTGIEVFIIRIIALILILGSGGTGLLIYFLLIYFLLGLFVSET